jgi:hypothetical protein
MRELAQDRELVSRAPQPELPPNMSFRRRKRRRLRPQFLDGRSTQFLNVRHQLAVFRLPPGRQFGGISLETLEEMADSIVGHEDRCAFPEIIGALAYGEELNSTPSEVEALECKVKAAGPALDCEQNSLCLESFLPITARLRSLALNPSELLC